MDDLDDALEAAAASPLVAVVPPEVFTEDMTRLRPLVESLVSGFAANRVHMADPLQRQQLVELREALAPVIDQLVAAKKVIDGAFLAALTDSGAKRLEVPGHGAAIYEPARGEYVGDWKLLRSELAELAASTGNPPLAAVHDALVEEVVVKPNHTRLNALARNYGAQVADIIDRRRQFITPPPQNGRVRYG